MTTNTVGNTLENGLAGNYQVNIVAFLKEAWQKNKGFKGLYWGALVLIMLISIVFIVFKQLTHHILIILGFHSIIISSSSLVLAVIDILLQWGLISGFILLVLRNVSGQPNRISVLFSVLKSPCLILKIFLSYLVILLFMLIPVALLFIPAIFKTAAPESHSLLGISFAGLYLVCIILIYYILFATSFFMPLLLNRKLGPWQAVTTSIKIINKHWFKLLLFYICTCLMWILPGAAVLGISLIVLPFKYAISLGIIAYFISYIWLLPMVSNAYGILYREAVGIEIKPMEAR